MTWIFFSSALKIKECVKVLLAFYGGPGTGKINKRTENISHSIEKMDNAMQNIILQEIEDLEGILIATTNLTSNLDSAFERRFLFKIEFHKPATDVKERYGARCSRILAMMMHRHSLQSLISQVVRLRILLASVPLISSSRVSSQTFRALRHIAVTNSSKTRKSVNLLLDLIHKLRNYDKSYWKNH